MKVNLCGRRYTNLHGNWANMYLQIIQALHSLNAEEINISGYITLNNAPDYVSHGIKDSDNHIYVYNHTHLNDIKRNNFFIGKKALFVKPTGPSPAYFTIDELGYACSSSITYSKPPFENIDESLFFNGERQTLIKNREHKWSDRETLQFINNPPRVPKEHILVIGQMPGDETVTKMSFGDHWIKFKSVVEYLLPLYKDKLVVKVHPTLEREATEAGWAYFKQNIGDWMLKGATVLYGFESLHDILPHTKVAIVENSTAGIDCLLYEVPVISYGFPEYHWVTKDLRHLNMLEDYIEKLDWYDNILANKWISWYCTEYQCKDLESTTTRLKRLLLS